MSAFIIHVPLSNFNTIVYHFTVNGIYKVSKYATVYYPRPLLQVILSSIDNRRQRYDQIILFMVYQAVFLHHLAPQRSHLQHTANSLRVKQKEKPEVLHIIYVKYHGTMNMVNSVVEDSIVETV